MASEQTTGVTITGISHDLLARRSVVTLVWNADGEKRVSLDVPFNTGLDELRAAAEGALRALARECEVLSVNLPS